MKKVFLFCLIMVLSACGTLFSEENPLDTNAGTSSLRAPEYQQAEDNSLEESSNLLIETQDSIDFIQHTDGEGPDQIPVGDDAVGGGLVDLSDEDIPPLDPPRIDRIGERTGKRERLQEILEGRMDRIPGTERGGKSSSGGGGQKN